MKVTMDRFQEAVEAAIDSIPEPFQPYLENTQFVIELRSKEGLLGLYEGATALEAGEWMPERVTIYKDGHEAEADSWEELVEEVRRTILHEVGHHFGMEEEDLPY
jgi:predicted Zn-dependent protease with MMP-like domain